MRLLQYLKGTTEFGLVSKRDSSAEPIALWTDSDYAGDVATARSTVGFALFVGGNLVLHCSKRFASTMFSLHEAELLLVFRGCQRLQWVRTVLEQIDH
jgi:hypothetical protein